MNIKVTLGILATAMTASILQAGEPDLSKLPPASTQKDITFAKDIQPIFKEHCSNCHGADRQKGGIRLDTLEAALKGGHEGKVVLPSKAEKSTLLISVARLNGRDAMPPLPRDNTPKGDKPAPRALTAEEVGLIRAWIDQGAK